MKVKNSVLNKSEDSFETLRYRWQNNDYGNSQIIFLYFLYCLKEELRSNCIQRKNIRVQRLNLDQLILTIENNPNHFDYNYFFENYKIQKVKAKVHFTLHQLLNSNWSVDIEEVICSPQKLLEMQSQGRRVVNLFFDSRIRLNPILSKRNGLDFLIHDLEHAYEFFHDSHLYKIQIQMFRLLKHLDDNDFFRKYLIGPEMKQRYYYLISDMNTHWGHTFIYMRGMIPKQDLMAEFERMIEILPPNTHFQAALYRFWFKELEEGDDAIIENYILSIGSIAAPKTPAESPSLHE